MNTKFSLASQDQVHKQGQATGLFLVVPWQVPADSSATEPSAGGAPLAPGPNVTRLGTNRETMSPLHWEGWCHHE